MAQKIHVELVDDLDGSPAEETVTFGLDGKVYEIDLNDKNAGKLRGALDAFVTAARKVGGGKKKSGNSKAVREWAREQGYEVSNVGQVPNNIKEAYDLAHA